MDNDQIPVADAAETTTVAGSFNFKDWWITVWLRDTNVEMPDECACCGTDEELGEKHLPLERSVGAVTYPICEACTRHAKMDDRVVGFSTVIAGLLLLVGHFYFFGLAIPGNLLMLFLYVFVYFLIVGAIYLPLSLFYGRDNSCPDKTWPIEEVRDPNEEPVLGEDTLRTDEKEAREKSKKYEDELGEEGVGLRMRNLKYAKIFMELNGESTDDIPYIRENM